MIVQERRIRAEHLDIKLDQAPLNLLKPQLLKLYNMTTLLQKIKLWWIVFLFRIPGK